MSDMTSAELTRRIIREELAAAEERYYSRKAKERAAHLEIVRTVRAKHRETSRLGGFIEAFLGRKIR